MTSYKPVTTRRGFSALLIALASAFGAGSKEYKQAQVRGYRQGKHNGRHAGAFGGCSKMVRAAKASR